MAGRGQRQRSNKNKHQRAPRKKREILPGPTGVNHIPDHLLELVLLRVDSSLALIRAAFTCKRWRGIVADTAFLARFRSLHTAHVAGNFHVVDPSYSDKLLPDGNSQAFVPDPSTADVINRRHFSLDFLPELDGAWELADSRGSLLLIYRWRTDYLRKPYFPNFVVCKPLSRRYQGIGYPLEMRRKICFGAFLLDGVAADDKGGCISMSNFRVIVAVYEYGGAPHGRHAPRASVFSGSDASWNLGQSAAGVPLPTFSVLKFVGRTRWSLYWAVQRDGVMVMFSLDNTTVEFSLVSFPNAVVGVPDELSTFRVVGGEDGAVRVVRVIDTDLVVFRELQRNGEWVKEMMVRLPEATSGLPGREEADFQQPAVIVAANATSVLLTPRGQTLLFSVELDTREAERTHERNKYAGAAYPYELPWPPALQACRGTEYRRRRRCR